MAYNFKLKASPNDIGKQEINIAVRNQRTAEAKYITYAQNKELPKQSILRSYT